MTIRTRHARYSKIAHATTISTIRTTPLSEGAPNRMVRGSLAAGGLDGIGIPLGAPASDSVVIASRRRSAQLEPAAQTLRSQAPEQRPHPHIDADQLDAAVDRGEVDVRGAHDLKALRVNYLAVEYVVGERDVRGMALDRNGIRLR
jgi:hypothetical protein